MIPNSGIGHQRVIKARKGAGVKSKSYRKYAPITGRKTRNGALSENPGRHRRVRGDWRIEGKRASGAEIGTRE